MHLAALHRKISADTHELYVATAKIFPIQIPPQYDGKLLSIRRFITRLNEATEPLGLFNEIELDPAVDPGRVQYTALWLDKSELPENDSHASIRMLWHLNPKSKRVLMNQGEWNYRRYYFWQFVIHELIHRYRDQETRTYRPTSTQRDLKAEQAYYGSCDEIETHAHSAAMELVDWWGHLNYRNALYKSKTYTANKGSCTTLQTYLMVFADTPGHPALKHFKRKMRAWYQVIKNDRTIYETLQLPNLTE